MLILFLYFRLARLFRLSSVLNCANLKINEVWKKQYNILNPRTILVDTQKGATFCRVEPEVNIAHTPRCPISHCWWLAGCLTKGLKRRNRLVHLLNDGQGCTCHRAYTCHTARSTATLRFNEISRARKFWDIFSRLKDNAVCQKAPLVSRSASRFAASGESEWCESHNGSQAE